MSNTNMPTGEQFLTVGEVKAKLRIGHTKFYEMVAAKLIPVVKIGTATRVPLKPLEAWMASQYAPQPSDEARAGL